MASKVYASLCFFVAFVSTCFCQLDGSFWWLNQDLKAAALANANAATEVYKDVEDFVTENEESSVVSFVDDFGRVQIYKEPKTKDKLTQVTATAEPSDHPMKERQSDIDNDIIEMPDNWKIQINTARDNNIRNGRKKSIDDAFSNFSFGQLENVGECGNGDCAATMASQMAERDDCECKTYYECFSGNGKPSSSKTGVSKCANRVPYMICCVTPNLNTRSEPLSQPAPAQLRSYNSEIVFNEDPSIYSSGYNLLLNQRPKRSPSLLDSTLTDTSDPYWNIKTKNIDQNPSNPRNPLPKIVSGTNGYFPDTQDLCPDSNMRIASKPAETLSGIKKLPLNWNLKAVSEQVGNKQVSGGGLERDIDETHLIPKKLQHRLFPVFQEFNPGFGAPDTTQKSQMTTRKRKALADSDEDSDYYIPVPKMKHKAPKFGYGAVEPEQEDDGDYDSVPGDSSNGGDLIYTGCGEVYASTEDVASPRLKDKYSHSPHALSVQFGNEDHASRCTAALIHPRVAVVPAHCTSSSRHVNAQIQSPMDVQEKLVQVLQHPRFNPANRRNDIALLIWRTPLTLSPRLHPVCLPTPGTSFTSSFCTTSRTDGAGTRASVLNEEECEEQFLNSSPRRRQHSAKHFLCIVRAPKKSSCTVPDEENPLICLHSNRWHLAGTPTDLTDSPSLYTDISQSTSWIQQVLEDTYII